MSRFSLLGMALVVAACGPAAPPVADAGVDTRPLIDVFAAGPSRVAQGQAATLVFHVVDGATATIEPGVGEVTGRVTVEVVPTQTTTYTLTASREGRTETATVVVTVLANDAGPGPDDAGTRDDGGTSDDGGMTDGGTTDGGGTPDDGGTSDGGSTDGGGTTDDGGSTDDGGTSGDAGTPSDAGAVDGGPLIDVFAAAPAQVISGDPATLVFHVVDGATASITPSVGDVTGQTTVTVQPTQTTTYTLSATWGGRTETATATVTVTAAPPRAASIRATATGPLTAGVPVDVELSILDLSGAVDSTYTGTVQLTSDDARATLPAPVTFTSQDAGRKTVRLTFATAGQRTLTMVDTTRAQLQGTWRVPVVAASAQRLAVELDRVTTRAGEALALSVMVLDAFDNAVPATGTLGFTSTDAQLMVTSDRQLLASDEGVKLLALSLGTVGPQTVTVSLGSLSATTASVDVRNGPAASVNFGALASLTSGVATTARLEVRDAFGNVVTDFSGTFTLTTTDVPARPLADVVFAPADLGVKSFSLRLLTAGTQTVTATQGALSASTQVSVTAGPFAGFRLGVLPASAAAGQALPLAVSAVDAAGNVTSFTGQAHVTSTDTSATLPADFGLVSGAATVQVTFNSGGTHRVTVSNVAGSESAQSTAVTVSPPSVVFALSLPADVLAGVPTSVGFTAKDAQGNPVPFAGTVTLTTPGDGAAVVPAPLTLTGSEGGVATFTVTFNTLGAQTVVATSGSLSAQRGTTVHGLVYTDPIVGDFKVRLVRNAAQSSASLVHLDVVAAGGMAPSYATGFSLPLDATRVQASTPLLIEGNGYSLGSAPRAVGSALRNGVLMAGVSQKASGAGAKTTDTNLLSGAVLFSVRLRLDPAATVGVVFDGQALPASFRAAMRNRLGADVAEKADFGIGTLEVR